MEAANGGTKTGGTGLRVAKTAQLIEGGLRHIRQETRLSHYLRQSADALSCGEPKHCIGTR